MLSVSSVVNGLFGIVNNTSLRATMSAMKIALGADHAGFELKEKIKQKLTAQGIAVDDRGTDSTASCDYPDFGRAVAEEVAAHGADLGILVCSTGIGISIAANKVPGIRAAKVDTEFEAGRSREHNDANVLALGAETISEEVAFKIVDKWLSTPFAGGRHQRRVEKIAAIEREDEDCAGVQVERRDTSASSASAGHRVEDRAITESNSSRHNPALVTNMAKDQIMNNNPMERPLVEVDPQIAQAIEDEERRQHEGLELIASENFVSEAVLEAAGSVFTNKYAEGYPGKRYYGGCEFTDVVENLARDRAKQLFGAEHANVQPHSGSTANMAAYAAVIQPGDTILGLNLAHGGHLTHGHPLNFSGKTYKIVPYGVTKETETIDYDDLERIAERERPKLIIGGGSAYPRFIDFARMRQIADKVGAIYLVDMAHFAGLVAGGAHPSPVPHAQIVTTTTHKTLRGPRAGLILSKAEYAAPIDKVVFPGMQGGPLVHIIAAKAVCFREAMQPGFKDYARQIVANAKVLAQTLADEGFHVVSGGTDTHLMLVNVFAKGMLGSEAENALHEAGITVNKNAIPFDTNPPMKPSGIRIGTPALTTRGMKEAEMRQVGKWISEALHNRTDKNVLSRIRREVLELAEAFPLYASRRAKHAEAVRA